MNYLKVTIGILILLSASRFIPHPPNFTTLIALSFYVPVLLGIKFVPAVVLCFFITDIFIGFHSTTIFTWGSVILIGLISKYFNKSIFKRIFGSFTACFLFYIITNFGVWSLGGYGYTFNGLVLCYTLAIPFFIHTITSTLIFSSIIELVYSQIRIFKKLYWLIIKIFMLVKGF